MPFGHIIGLNGTISKSSVDVLCVALVSHKKWIVVNKVQDLIFNQTPLCLVVRVWGQTVRTWSSGRPRDEIFRVILASLDGMIPSDPKNEPNEIFQYQDTNEGYQPTFASWPLQNITTPNL